MIKTLGDSLTILRWVLAVLAVFALVSVIVQNNTIREQQKIGRQIALENNTYHRTVACILSVPLDVRTPDYISNCYLRAEQASGVKVDHFGNR